MLPRVLEPEVMDSLEEAHDYDAMDHAEVNRLFVEDFLTFAGEVRGEILDLGTGTAQIPIALCRRDPTARVRAIDHAANMLDLARANVELAGLTERIRLERVDAKRLPYSDGTFAAIVSNSIVHHIPAPRSVLAEAVRVAKSGVAIFIRDLARPNTDGDVARLVETYAGGANEHQQKMFDDSLRAALTLDEIAELVAELGFDKRTVGLTSDRHWTWQARR